MKNETCLSVASQSSTFQSTMLWSYGDNTTSML